MPVGWCNWAILHFSAVSLCTLYISNTTSFFWEWYSCCCCFIWGWKFVYFVILTSTKPSKLAAVALFVAIISVRRMHLAKSDLCLERTWKHLMMFVGDRRIPQDSFLWIVLLCSFAWTTLCAILVPLTPLGCWVS